MTHPAARSTPTSGRTTPTSGRRRGLRPTRIAAFLFLLTPLLEIIAIIGMTKLIGGWATFFSLIAISVIGMVLIKKMGGRAFRALQEALRSGRMPAKELADGIVVLVGGTLMMVPGFITGVIGILLVLPFTRSVARRLLQAVIARRMLTRVTVVGVTTPGSAGMGSATFTQWPPAGAPNAGSDRTGAAAPGAAKKKAHDPDEVIEGEIID